MGKIQYGSTGVSYQPQKVDLKVGGAPKCPRCQERVYFNEEKKALGKSWHTRCFTCASCKKHLDSNNCSGHDGEVYCMRCHRKEFGPKGYGFAGGMAGLSTESTYYNVRPVSPVNTHTVAEHIPSATIARDDPSCCPRCGKRVFFAEELKARGRKWHKLCFKCGKCNKILEPGRCSEHESEVYCQSCYVREFGPSGYGVAGLSSDYRPEARYVRAVSRPENEGKTNSGGATNDFIETVEYQGPRAHESSEMMNGYSSQDQEPDSRRESNGFSESVEYRGPAPNNTRVQAQPSPNTRVGLHSQPAPNSPRVQAQPSPNTGVHSQPSNDYSETHTIHHHKPIIGYTEVPSDSRVPVSNAAPGNGYHHGASKSFDAASDYNSYPSSRKYDGHGSSRSFDAVNDRQAPHKYDSRPAVVHGHSRSYDAGDVYSRQNPYGTNTSSSSNSHGAPSANLASYDHSMLYKDPRNYDETNRFAQGTSYLFKANIQPEADAARTTDIRSTASGPDHQWSDGMSI